MYKKKIASLLMVIFLLLAMFGTAAAQNSLPEGTNETLVVTVSPEPTEPVVNYGHPVVYLLDQYFGTGIPNPIPAPGDEAGLSTVGEQIAGYHADGMGFGVLVKLYSLATAAQQTCAGDAASPSCLVTVDSLVTEFNSGAGLGEMMKTYGRPAAMGVGQVRKAMNEDNTSPDGQDEDGNGKGNGKGKSKGKGK